MEQVNVILKVVFVIITLLTVFQFYKASQYTKSFLLVVSILAIIQMGLALRGFYENATALPPRFIFLLMPAVIIMIYLFFSKKGKSFLDSLDIKQLSFLHTIRIPVEITLYYLFVAKAIPQIMTFEGRNFDILAGISAPIIFYLGFIKKVISSKGLLVWNILCVGLLINIVVIAILSAKTLFQQFGLDQPNIAIAYFPFNWLASIVVPIVLLSHLATIRILLKGKN
jgi:hypothetical protein